LRSSVPNKNTVARLKSNIYPPKFWAGYVTDCVTYTVACNSRKVFFKYSCGSNSSAGKNVSNHRMGSLT